MLKCKTWSATIVSKKYEGYLLPGAFVVTHTGEKTVRLAFRIACPFALSTLFVLSQTGVAGGNLNSAPYCRLQSDFIPTLCTNQHSHLDISADDKPQNENKESEKSAAQRKAEQGRWVLRFKIKDGDDYLNQLTALGAEIIILSSDSEGEVLLYKDLVTSKEKKLTQENMMLLSKRFPMTDRRKDMLELLCKSLGLEGKSAKVLAAYFPEKLEQEMSRKELNYDGARVENIELTTFRVWYKEGKYEITVLQQKLKK